MDLSDHRLMTSDIPVLAIVIGGLAFGAGILACAWAAWATAKKLVASVNVEHIGESRGWL